VRPEGAYRLGRRERQAHEAGGGAATESAGHCGEPQSGEYGSAWESVCPLRSSLEDFPYLEHDDIAACLKYAATEVDHPILIAQ
jgi:hypothetical protein